MELDLGVSLGLTCKVLRQKSESSSNLETKIILFLSEALDKLQIFVFGESGKGIAFGSPY